MKKVMWMFAIIFLCGICSRSVLADEKDKEDGPWAHFTISLGGFFSTMNSDVRFGLKDLGAGIDVDLEEALGLDSSTTVFFGSGSYRFGRSRRHRVNLSYRDFGRDSTKVLLNDVPIFGDIIQKDTTVHTELDFRVIEGGYTYSFFLDDRMDLAIGGGLYVMPIEFKLTAAGKETKAEDITAPLPVLSLRGDFAITPKLFLKAELNVLYLEISNFKGSILGGGITLEYNVWKHVGFGLGYDHFRLWIEAEDDDYPGTDFIGNIEFEYAGLLLYTKIYW